MQNRTQSCWLHSIPKRSTAAAAPAWTTGGRINITFRKVLAKGGTENYYRYNVGSGPAFRWDEGVGEMRLWKERGGVGEGDVEEKGRVEEDGMKEREG